MGSFTGSSDIIAGASGHAAEHRHWQFVAPQLGQTAVQFTPQMRPSTVRSFAASVSSVRRDRLFCWSGRPILMVHLFRCIMIAEKPYISR
jgi:hypothetical protein